MPRVSTATFDRFWPSGSTFPMLAPWMGVHDRTSLRSFVTASREHEQSKRGDNTHPSVVGRDPFSPFTPDPAAPPPPPRSGPPRPVTPTGYDDPDQDLADAYSKYIAATQGDGTGGDDYDNSDHNGDSGDSGYGDYNGGDSGGDSGGGDSGSGAGGGDSGDDGGDSGVG